MRPAMDFLHAPLQLNLIVLALRRSSLLGTAAAPRWTTGEPKDSVPWHPPLAPLTLIRHMKAMPKLCWPGRATRLFIITGSGLNAMAELLQGPPPVGAV